MVTWKDVAVLPDTSLADAMARLDASGLQVVLVLAHDGRLRGVVTDGNIRRAMLAGKGLLVPVSEVMTTTPTAVPASTPRLEMLSLMRRESIHQLPLLSDDGRVVGLATLDELITAADRPNCVVIMAGGLGTRLRELTEQTPKPMLPVGDRPLLEITVRRMVEQGLRNIWLAVNYRADQIENHFGDGSSFGAQIRYLREQTRLGTAGALSLLPDPPPTPILVSNADLLVTVDYGEMLDAHQASGALATMGVREYEYQIPYGVVRSSDDVIAALEEKPVHRALINAGIYVLSPETLAFVPRDTFFDMPELFTALIGSSKPTRCHRVNGYWLDIGRAEDLHKANGFDGAHG